MNIENMKKNAVKKVEEKNLESRDFRSAEVYENFLGGTLIDVEFKDREGHEALNHVYFENEKEPEVYRRFEGICKAVCNYKERRLFFRFLELVGIGGLIVLALTIIFSILLSVLAIWGKDTNPSIIKIVEVSFTLILGYFFGSQSRKAG